MDVLFAGFGGHGPDYLSLIIWAFGGCICWGFWSPFVLVVMVLIDRRWNRRRAANPPPDRPV